MNNDTIAAISTPMSGSGGISIIRISGNDAISVADRIFRSPSGRKLEDVKSHTISYGHVISSSSKEKIYGDCETATGKQGEVIDEVLVSVMRAPRTFTAEDTVEINCHGGMLVTKRILKEVLAAGATLADPGEFTKRAFINGRIDLSEAEAVIDVINAKNEYALKASINQLSGGISSRIKIMRDEILDHVAFMEAAMDDPEHISMEGHMDKMASDVDKYIEETKKLIKTYSGGKILREGVDTVILGRTNAGKSSLLNLLTGSDTAIVTDIEGTTRDTVRESVRLGGISLNLADTAGIRDTDDAVEAIGVEKALDNAKNAELILLVIDSSRKLSGEDRDIIKHIFGKKCIILLNKADKEMQTDKKDVLNFLSDAGDEYKDIKILEFSTVTSLGLNELEKEIEEIFSLGDILVNNEPVIINERHLELLNKAKTSLEYVKTGIETDAPEDLLTVDMMDAYTELGSILGEEIEDDLADRIFEKFCMGK